MAYAVAAQARPTMFTGAVSLGFCPRIVTPKPLGHGSALAARASGEGGRYELVPSPSLVTPWFVFQGRDGSGCDPDAPRRFVAAVDGATLVDVAADEHVLADPESWLPALRRTLDRLAGPPATPAASTSGLGDLPLIEVPARGTSAATLAVILSGDGGWASIDRELGDGLADAGVGVVGLNSLSYFWTRRTPDGAAADLARILIHYRAAWRLPRVLLIGYSRGADVLPFLAARLPPELRAATALVVLLGPGRTTDFEFHVTDWLGGDDPSALPTRPEVDKLRGLPLLCVQGADEDDSLCPELDADTAERMVLPGGHHFGGDYELIAARIRRAAGLAPATQPSADGTAPPPP
jgi:type IV secretory pathway VirJ component